MDMPVLDTLRRMRICKKSRLEGDIARDEHVSFAAFRGLVIGKFITMKNALIVLKNSRGECSLPLLRM